MEKYTSDDIEFLKDLQYELINQEHDSQAAPRFWVIMDYRTVPGHEDYDNGWIEYFYNDGDHVAFHSFEDLKEFIEEYYDDEINNDQDLRELLYNNNGNFYELWEYIEDHHDGNGYFDTVFAKEEEFIVPNTLFLTKEEAKRHLELNHYHYSSKAHTYAMTAWRAPKVERLMKILETIDWCKLT